jgi:hypothetical protein
MLKLRGCNPTPSIPPSNDFGIAFLIIHAALESAFIIVAYDERKRPLEILFL